MGMLDDAIREHLELKRRRGADPGEVEREQAEALAPLNDRGLATEDRPDADGQQDAPVAQELETPVTGTLGTGPGEELPETAELDMERALHGDAGTDHDTTAEPHDGHESGSSWHGAEDFELSAEEAPVEHDAVPEHTDAQAAHSNTGFPDEQPGPAREP